MTTPHATCAATAADTVARILTGRADPPADALLSLSASSRNLSRAQRVTLVCYSHLAARLDPSVQPRALDVVRALGLERESAWIESRMKVELPHPLPNSVGELVDCPTTPVINLVTETVTEVLRGAAAVARRLPGLEGPAFQHASDRQAIEALQHVPMFDRLTSFFVDKYTRDLALSLTSSNIHVTPRSMPSLASVFDEACEVLDVDTKPQLYVEPGALNAYTIGGDQHIVVVSAGAVSLLSRDELLFVLGHELGHVKCGHVVYGQMARWIGRLGQLVGDFTLGIGELAVRTTIEPALAAWNRRSEFSADRAGLLACQDIEAAVRAMAKIAGYPARYYAELDADAFLEQARAFEARLDESAYDRIATLVSSLNATHPHTVVRAAELNRWTSDGFLDDLVAMSPEQRRTLSASISTDPLKDELVCRAAHALGSWAADRFSGSTLRDIRSARQLLRFGDRNLGSSMKNVFRVDLEVERKAADEVTYRLIALVSGERGPAKVTLDLPPSGWNDTPPAIRDTFIRENPSRLAFQLYSAA